MMKNKFVYGSKTKYLCMYLNLLLLFRVNDTLQILIRCTGRWKLQIDHQHHQV